MSENLKLKTLFDCCLLTEVHFVFKHNNFWNDNSNKCDSCYCWNNKLMFDEKNSSNFAIYHTYKNSKLLFPFYKFVLSKEKILIKRIFVYIRQFVKGFSGPFNQVYAFYFWWATCVVCRMYIGRSVIL